MAESIKTKQCSNCKQIKSFSEFNKDITHKDNHASVCKLCRYAYHNYYRQTKKGKIACNRYEQSAHGRAKRKQYRESMNGRATMQRFKQTKKYKTGIILRSRHYRQKYPIRIKANNTVTYAIMTGRLPRPDTLKCHYCPAQAKEYHHWHGYEPEHWLDVVSVCCSCHRKYEKQLKRNP